jgi:hypothetical protein
MKTTTRIATVLLLLPFYAVVSRGVEPPKKPVEYRMHTVLRSTEDKSVHFEVTEIVRVTDDMDENEVLVNDVQHGQFVLTRRTSFGDQEVSHSISDVKKKEFVRSSFKMPFSAKTRKDTLAESAQNSDLKMLPALITVTTNGGEWRSVDTGAGEWQRLRDLRYSVRQTVPFHLLEAIERMRGGVFATPIGGVFYSLVGKYVVYQTADDAKLELEEVAAPPVLRGATMARQRGRGFRQDSGSLLT